MQPGKEQHFRGYAGRRDRRKDSQGSIECGDDQGQAAQQLKDAHRQPNFVGNRFQGRHGLLGMGELPHRAHHGMQGEKDLKHP
jgi:hypothetical protein